MEIRVTVNIYEILVDNSMQFNCRRRENTLYLSTLMIIFFPKISTQRDAMNTHCRLINTY